MNLFGPLTRAIVLGGVLVCAGVAPALAGPSEIAALEKYLGTWNGKGSLSGSQPQPVSCKMALTSGNAGKINYTGRCQISGQQLSVFGTIAYVDGSHRYEAVMNSGIGGFRGQAIGKLSGDTIVFDLQQRADDDQGNDISITAKIVLSGSNKIECVFHATFNDSGDTIDAKIPFSKA